MSLTVKISLFNNLNDIPADIMRQLRFMRWPNGAFADILRQRYQPDSNYRVDGVVVALADTGEAMGWGMYYHAKEGCFRNYLGGNCLGFWVRATARRKGVGKALVDVAYKTWGHTNPRVFDNVRLYMWPPKSIKS